MTPVRFLYALSLIFVACAHQQHAPPVTLEAPAPESVGPPFFDEGGDTAAAAFDGDVFSREAISAETAPLPLAGGTVLVSRSLDVWVANPDAGVVDVVKAATNEVAHTYTLGNGSRPFALAEGKDRVYVVLRG